MFSSKLVKGFRSLPSVNRNFSRSLFNPTLVNYFEIPISKVVQPVSLTPAETLVKYVFGIPFIPLAMFSTPPNHATVVLRFGKFEGLRYEGLRFSMPVGASLTNVFLGNKTFKLSDAKVVDSQGNPIVISAMINYRVVYPQNYVVNTQSSSQYIHDQAETVIKNVASNYDYDSLCVNKTIDALNAVSKITDVMKKELQKLVDYSGAEILDMSITDIKYAPEISSLMLIKQQARAYANAKDEIAKSAIGIVDRTLKSLEQNGLKIQNQDSQDKLVTNLLTVITSGNSVQPTISV